ncbi:MAG: sigma-70 factor domain-containing protein, partial [Acidiferrobacterales bacterium]
MSPRRSTRNAEADKSAENKSGQVTTEIAMAKVDTKTSAPAAKVARKSNSESHADATRLYLKEIGFSPLLTAEEEVLYARLAQKGDDAGRKRMIESNLRLVVKIARRYMNRGLALLDLIEEGNL